MAKRVNMLKAPFNYHWPKVQAVTCVRETGPVLLKDEVADAAIAQGYAVPFEPAQRAKKATTRRKPATRASDAAHAREADGMGPAGVLPHGGPDDGAPVADAG